MEQVCVQRDNEARTECLNVLEFSFTTAYVYRIFCDASTESTVVLF